MPSCPKLSRACIIYYYYIKKLNIRKITPVSQRDRQTQLLSTYYSPDILLLLHYSSSIAAWMFADSLTYMHKISQICVIYYQSLTSWRQLICISECISNVSHPQFTTFGDHFHFLPTQDQVGRHSVSYQSFLYW